MFERMNFSLNIKESNIKTKKKETNNTIENNTYNCKFQTYHYQLLPKKKDMTSILNYYIYINY